VWSHPLVGWRIAAVVGALSEFYAAPGETAWPWAPVFIVVYLAVLFAVAATQRSVVTTGIWAVSCVIVLWQANANNRPGLIIFVTILALVGDQVRRRLRAQRDLMELTAYRIVQEALSNAGRHAPGAAVSVVLTRVHNGLDVSARNGPAARPSTDGAGARARGGGRIEERPGHGLRGMRERAAMLDAELTVGYFPTVPAYLATYGYTAASLESLARVLFGEVNPRGQVPVTIPAADGTALYPVGHGLHYS
jgi:hypothetical protein